jgi:hypothetical protein
MGPVTTGANNSKGTSGYATIAAPGNDPYVITVGAIKTMGTGTLTAKQTSEILRKIRK